MVNTRRKRVVVLVLGGLTSVLLVLVAASFIEASIRGYVVGRINDTLQGYTVEIKALYFQPIMTFGAHGVTVVQDAFPDQPVGQIERLTVGIHWRDLLSGRLVADLHVRQPVLRIDVRQLSTEMEDEIPFAERGWQESLEELYPLKVNELWISSGAVTYTEDPFPPLQLSRINLEAENIRNVRRAGDVFPSTIQLEATVLERGSLVLDGRANFLAEPHPGFRGEITLQDLDLSPLAPLAQRYRMSVRRGTLESGEVMVEFAPHRYQLDVRRAEVRGLIGDYIYAGQELDLRTEEVAEEQQLQVRVGSLKVFDSELGLVNRTESPDYRVYLAVREMEMENYSGGFQEGPATVRMQGEFMGSGHSVLHATLRPEQEGPDFEVRLAVENTEMTTLSDVAQAHTGLTVAEGSFSLYTEIAVQEGQINGYVKPIFRDVEFGDEEEDRDWFQRIYEGVAQALVRLLENRRQEVAAVTELSGPVEDPEADTWATIASLLRNAFFEAILPGFEDGAY
jgi:hypothetical protein